MHRVIAILISALFVMACSSASTAGDRKVHERVPYTEFTRVDKELEGLTKHFKESRFEVTGDGLYSVEALLIDGTVHVGENNFDIVIHDTRDRDVPGADVSAVARMKDGGEGSEARVEESDIHGLYGVRDLDVNGPGDWEVEVRVKKGAKADTAVFDFPGVR